MSVIGRIRGKARVKIERLDSKWVPYETHVDVLKDNADRDCEYEEDFQCMDCGTVMLPAQAYDLKPGESVTVEANFEFEYTRDYWGEYDFSLDWSNEKVVPDEGA